MRYTSSLIALTLVAACGGGGGDSAADDYTDFRETAIDIAEEVDDLPRVDPSTLPTSGTVTYDGVLFIETPRDVDILGDLEMSFDFGNARFDGKADDFVDNTGDRYDGRLNIRNGQINRSSNPSLQPTFLGDVDGTITDSDDNYYTVGAEIGGYFFGDDEEYIAGSLRGNVDSNLEDFTLDNTSNSIIVGEK